MLGWGCKSKEPTFQPQVPEGSTALPETRSTELISHSGKSLIKEEFFLLLNGIYEKKKEKKKVDLIHLGD